MKHQSILVTLLTIVNLNCNGQTKSLLKYPTAERIDQIDVYHQTEVPDPYQWMEELESPELNQWITKQEMLYDSFLSKDQKVIERFKSDISELYKNRIAAPILRQDLRFQIVNEGDKEFSKIYLEKEERRTLLVDLNEMNDATKNTSVNSYSPDGRYLTLNESINKSRYRTIYVHSTEKNTTLSDKIDGYYNGRSSIAWTRDSKGFYYSYYIVPEDQQAKLPKAVFKYHEVGTSQDKDITIFEDTGDENLIFTGSITKDNRFLVLNIYSPNYNGNKIYVKEIDDRGRGFVKLVDSFEDQYSFLYKKDDLFYFRTNKNAPKYRVVATDQLSLSSNWKEVIPESDKSIISNSRMGEYLALQFSEGTKNTLKIYDLNGAFKYELEPDGLSIFISGDRHNSYSYLTKWDFTGPSSIYKLRLETGEMELHDKMELPLDPEDVITEAVEYTSKDGTKVPMRLVYKKGLKKNPNTPIFLYGYGAFGWSAYPWQGYMMSWVKNGGIYAVPNIRGGGINGTDWHKMGSRKNKQKTIDDYISAAEWLIDSGYSRKGLIVANGGSASGLLPAIAINERPDLYGASIIDYPVLDMLRYHKFGSANWANEFGTSDDPEDFQLLRKYSPYHNINTGSCYPPTIVQVGELDITTTPMHGYKYAAALQNALSNSCGSPVLLKISRGAGHSAGATRKDRIQTQAEQMAFLFKVLQLDYQ